MVKESYDSRLPRTKFMIDKNGTLKSLQLTPHRWETTLMMTMEILGTENWSSVALPILDLHTERVVVQLTEASVNSLLSLYLSLSLPIDAEFFWGSNMIVVVHCSIQLHRRTVDELTQDPLQHYYDNDNPTRVRSMDGRVDRIESSIGAFWTQKTARIQLCGAPNPRIQTVHPIWRLTTHNKSRLRLQIHFTTRQTDATVRRSLASQGPWAYGAVYSAVVAYVSGGDEELVVR
ncbi:hypothetical protein ACLOJK_012740 [Asimina triloba]